MNIIDTTKSFFYLLETDKPFDLSSLERYYNKYPVVFSFYFENHCPRTTERLTTALNRYPLQQNEMRHNVAQLPTIITETLKQVATYLDLALDLDFYLLVGGFGSNAYINRKINADVFLAIEKLSSNPNNLRVIDAHEIGHVSHNILLDQAGFDWSNLEWKEGTTSLYREGIATYISMQAVPDQLEAVYYQYDDSGEDWLTFCKENHSTIVAAFLEDAMVWTYAKEREWFRLTGGKRFGYSRLGYYLGTEFIHDCVEKLGEKETITLWAHKKIKPVVISWLELELGASCNKNNIRLP